MPFIILGLVVCFIVAVILIASYVKKKKEAPVQEEIPRSKAIIMANILTERATKVIKTMAINFTTEDNLAVVLNHAGIYDLFDSEAVDVIEADVLEELKHDHAELPSEFMAIPEEDKKSFIREIVENDEEVKKARMDVFMSATEQAMKEVEEVEKEEVAFHATFGKEEEGDPELHSAELEHEEEPKIPSVEDLEKLGTVEEYTDNLKEI